MPGRRLWVWGAVLIGGICVVGCQSSGSSSDRESRIPSFGVDEVPRQSEPALEDDGQGSRAVASRGSLAEDDDDESDDEPAARKGNLLTRLLPGRDKETLERKPLPVNGRSAGTDDDDDDDEF
ncbi:MAG TPA: hypothetical protein VL475_05365 [Planctomycetaceae bacterium]|nr:hypothetical protein [Planctomycetaceae bacterium]